MTHAFEFHSSQLSQLELITRSIKGLINTQAPKRQRDTDSDDGNEEEELPKTSNRAAAMAASNSRPAELVTSKRVCFPSCCRPGCACSSPCDPPFLIPPEPDCFLVSMGTCCFVCAQNALQQLLFQERWITRRDCFLVSMGTCFF